MKNSQVAVPERVILGAALLVVGEQLAAWSARCGRSCARGAGRAGIDAAARPARPSASRSSP